MGRKEQMKSMDPRLRGGIPPSGFDPRLNRNQPQNTQMPNMGHPDQRSMNQGRNQLNGSRLIYISRVQKKILNIVSIEKLVLVLIRRNIFVKII